MEDSKLIIRQIEQVRQEIKEIHVDVVDLKVGQGKNQVILQEHMRRTEANENQINEQKQFKWYFAGIAVILTALTNIIGRLF